MNDVAYGLFLALVILAGMGAIAYVVSRFYKRPPDRIVPLNLQFQPRSINGTTIRITVLFRIRQSQNTPPKITGLYEEVDAALSLYCKQVPNERITALVDNELPQVVSVAMKSAYQHYGVEIESYSVSKIEGPGVAAGDIYA